MIVSSKNDSLGLKHCKKQPTSKSKGPQYKHPSGILSALQFASLSLLPQQSHFLSTSCYIRNIYNFKTQSMLLSYNSSLPNTPALHFLKKISTFFPNQFPQFLIQQFPFLPCIPLHSHRKVKQSQNMQIHCVQKLVCVAIEEAWQNDQRGVGSGKIQTQSKKGFQLHSILISRLSFLPLPDSLQLSTLLFRISSRFLQISEKAREKADRQAASSKSVSGTGTMNSFMGSYFTFLPFLRLT